MNFPFKALFFITFFFTQHSNAQIFGSKNEKISSEFANTLSTEKPLSEIKEVIKFYLENLDDFSTKKKDFTTNDSEDEWKLKCKFKVSKSGLIGQQTNGAVHYHLVLLVRDSTVFYRFSNFRFQPYYRNRYGRFVPQNNVYYPLETHWEGESLHTWQQHQAATQEHIQQNIAALQSVLLGENIAEK